MPPGCCYDTQKKRTEAENRLNAPPTTETSEAQM
jgi:hypothetical protein